MTHQEASDAVMLAIAGLLPAEYRGVYSDLEGLRARLGDLYVGGASPAPTKKGR